MFVYLFICTVNVNKQTCRIHTRSDIDRITPNIVEQFGCANHSGGDIAKIKANPGIKCIWFIFWHDASEMSKTNVCLLRIFSIISLFQRRFHEEKQATSRANCVSFRLLPFPRKWDRDCKRFFSWNQCVILESISVQRLCNWNLNHCID